MESSVEGAVSLASSESLDDNESVVPADLSALVTSLPDGASVGSSVESSHDSSTSEGTSPSASSGSVLSSSVGDALLSLSSESSQDLSTSEDESTPLESFDDTSGASHVVSEALSVDNALSAVSVESLHDSSSPVPADVSSDLSEFPGLASLGTSSESSDNLSSGHSSGPLASREGLGSSSVLSALLSLISEASDDLGSVPPG